jgi:hypothetical protein
LLLWFALDSIVISAARHPDSNKINMIYAYGPFWTGAYSYKNNSVSGVGLCRVALRQAVFSGRPARAAALPTPSGKNYFHGL